MLLITGWGLITFGSKDNIKKLEETKGFKKLLE